MNYTDVMKDASGSNIALIIIFIIRFVGSLKGSQDYKSFVNQVRLVILYIELRKLLRKVRLCVYVSDVLEKD